MSQTITITIKWSDHIQLSVLVAVWLEMASEMEWSEKRWRRKEKKKLLTTFTKCALVSCLFLILTIYGESKILLCYVYMAKDWKKRQCSNICLTLHSPALMCLRVSVYLFVCSAQLSDFFSSFLLLVLLKIQIIYTWAIQIMTLN